MTLVVAVDPARATTSDPAVTAAAEALAAGELVVFPTETVYAVAARPDDPEATGRLFEAKARPARLSLPVLVPTAAAAWEVARATGPAKRLAARLWPGPLTMVLRRNAGSRSWYLGEHAETVGVRVPDHPLTQALLERVGPLAATSANPSGRPPLTEMGDLVKTFGERVAVYLVGEGTGHGEERASTVVDLTSGPPRILRRGPIAKAEIEAALDLGPAGERTG